MNGTPSNSQRLLVRLSAKPTKINISLTLRKEESVVTYSIQRLSDSVNHDSVGSRDVKPFNTSFNKVGARENPLESESEKVPQGK